MDLYVSKLGDNSDALTWASTRRDVRLQDCLLIGYQVFGSRAGEISYTTKGRVAAYVEYEQPVPAGMERLRYWPVEAFAAVQKWPQEIR